MKISKYILLLFITTFLLSCTQSQQQYRAVLCVPVYGQSLALGEEAERITDFDSLANYANGRIVTENLDHKYGFFDNDELKQYVKKLVDYKKRSFELSVYNMAKEIANATGSDTLICIFPGGQGATAIANLSKGTPPYQKFMEDIQTAYEEATDNGWEFIIPAICWMQGESDIVDYPDTDYQQMLKQIREDMNVDINNMTHQKNTIPYICYQANSLTRAEKFNANAFDCRETYVPQTFVNLLKTDKNFWASGPTYPYTCVNEIIHIDAIGQQSIGALAAKSVLGILRGKDRFCGLIPISITAEDSLATIHFNVPYPPLIIDTLQVAKAENYGFSVINKENKNIICSIFVDGSTVRITCSESPIGCKVRYAVNGDFMKSGNQHGPRGNLRDSSGNWCYQFDMGIP